MREPQPVMNSRLFRQPDVSKTEIVFVYAGDLWLVDRPGGTARRLTAIDGVESWPRFSPDGTTVAFSAGYTGNLDLYTLPTSGGVPERLTFHPAADRVVDWHPDGERLLFASRREAGAGAHEQLFEIPAGGGPATRLPIPVAADAAYSPDGRFLVFQMLGRALRLWRGYRGGLPGGLFVFDRKDGGIFALTEPEGVDAAPMWHGDDLYFVSDRTDEKSPHAIFDLWVFRRLAPALRRGPAVARRRRPRRLTRGDEDLRAPAIGPGDLVFVRGAQLFRVSLDAPERSFQRPAPVALDLIPDHSAAAPRSERVDDEIGALDLSADGSRLLVTARGSIFVLPVKEEAPTRRIDRAGVSLHSAERGAVWTEDGRILFHSDAGEPQGPGEVELVLQGIDGDPGEALDLGEGFRYRIASHGQRAAFFDQQSRLHVAGWNHAGRLSDRVVTQPERAEGLTFFDLAQLRPAWSPGGRVVVFHDRGANGHWRLVAYHAERDEGRRLTSGYFSDRLPVFDPSGEHLYFVTRRGLDSLRSELGGSAPAYFDTDRLARVRVDPCGGSLDHIFGSVDSFEGRVELLPLAACRLERIVPIGGERVVLLQGSATASGSRLALFEGSASPVLLFEDPGDFAVSTDGSTLVVLEKIASDPQTAKLWRIDLESEQRPFGRAEISVAGLAKIVEPRAEWRQLFRDSWRLVRDFFHDETRLEEIDWLGLYSDYEEQVAAVASRRELNLVLDRLYAEVGSSHTRVDGGDVERVDRVGVGLLGAGLVLDEGGRYRIETLLDPGRWRPEVAAPLIAAGVEEGSLLLAVDGVDLSPRREPWEAFLGKAGRRVSLRLGDPRQGASEREIEVTTLTLGEERLLRRIAWIEGNRARVEAVDARLGYVHLADAQTPRADRLGGRHLFERQLRAQLDRAAIVFDLRYNGGGQLLYEPAGEIVRRSFAQVRTRFGLVQSEPIPGGSARCALLVNGWTASAAELLAAFARHADPRITVFGSRTRGAIDFWNFGPYLVDQGFAQLANTIHVLPDGSPLGIEGWGVEPDQPVEQDLARLERGVDTQLEAAAAHLARQLP